MLKPRKTWRQISYVLFVVGIAFLLIPPYGKYCEQDYANQYYCAAYEITLTFGDAVEAHSGAITAVATIFIAWFTWTLWRSSEKMWKVTRLSIIAARRSANASVRQAKAAEDALTQLERPYIFVFGVRPIYRNGSGDFFVSYTVANFGKLPAIIDGAWIDWVISERGEPPRPPLLHDGHNLLASPILEASEKRPDIRAYVPIGMTTGGILVEILTTGPDGDQANRVVPQFDVPDGFDIFFRAVISYRGPFTSGHETGALWLYMPESFEFAIRGGGEYNYVK